MFSELLSDFGSERINLSPYLKRKEDEVEEEGRMRWRRKDEVEKEEEEDEEVEKEEVEEEDEGEAQRHVCWGQSLSTFQPYIETFQTLKKIQCTH